MKLPVDLRELWTRTLAWYNGYSPRDRRVILGILIAAGLSLCYLGIVDPILTYRKAIGKEIADGQEELERSMRFVGAKDTLRAEREDLRKRLTQAKGRLLPGGTATLGAAALQERANALASEKGISVQSTQVMKEENVDPFRKVAVRLTLSGELKPLAELVSAIEYQQQLAVPFIEVSRRGAVAGAKGPRTLSVTVEVSGFVQGGAPPKVDAADAEAAAAADTQPEGAPGAEGAAPAGPEGADAAPAAPGEAPAAPAAAAPIPPAAGAPPGGAAATIAPEVSPPAAPGAVPPTATGPPPSVPITFPPMVIPPPTVPATPPPPAQAPSHPDKSADDDDGGDD